MDSTKKTMEKQWKQKEQKKKTKLTIKENHRKQWKQVEKQWHQNKPNLKKNKDEKEVLKQAQDEKMQLSFFQLDDPLLEDIKDEILATNIDALTPI